MPEEIFPGRGIPNPNRPVDHVSGVTTDQATRSDRGSAGVPRGHHCSTRNRG